MKITIFFVLISFSTLALANPAHTLLSVKDRLRIHLWTEGLSEKNLQKHPIKKLPEELERPLRKI